MINQQQFNRVPLKVTHCELFSDQTVRWCYDVWQRWTIYYLRRRDCKWQEELKMESAHIKTRCSQAPEMRGTLWIRLKGPGGIFRICQVHLSLSQSTFISLSQIGWGGLSRGLWVSCMCLCVRCVKSKLENDHLSVKWTKSMAWSLKKSIVCVETTVTSPPAQNNLPARTGLSVVCLHWELFQTAHARRRARHSPRKHLALKIQRNRSRGQNEGTAFCLSVCLFVSLSL